jgi:multiple sugar transport system substrate-binding protein
MASLDLTFHQHTDDDLAPLTDRLEIFRRSHRNVELPVTLLPWETAWNALVRIALYKDGADVSEVGTTWLGSFVGMEALRAFTAPELSKLGGAASFLPASWQNGSLVGAQLQWGIPWLADTRVIFYWRDMLEHAGVDETTAFSSFTHMADTLTRLQSRGIPTPWAAFTGDTHNTLYNVLSWIWGAGGDVVTGDGAHMALDQDAAKAGLLAYFDLHRFMPPLAAPLEDADITNLFLEQRCAAFISGTWLLRNLRRQGIAPYTLSRIGVALPPGPPFVGGTMLAIWKHLHHGQEQLAMDLIRFLVTDPIWQDFYHQSGMLPARLDLLAQPLFADDPHYRVMIQGLRQGRTHTRLPMWGLIEERLSAALAQIWQEIRADPVQDKAALIDKYIDPLTRRLEATLVANPAQR